MDLKDKKVVVTGAGGFIGSHLAEELVARGAQVKTLVHYNSQNFWGNLEKVDKKILDRIEVVPGDILDQIFVKAFLKDIDVVFHLAALISIPFSYHAPLLFFKVNVEGTINVLQACLENGVQKVVVTSTSEVYGTAQYTPIDEGHQLQGQSPYSASKIGAEKSAQSYYCSFDLPVTIIRPFNTYGPRQSARAVIPTIITQALVEDEVHLGALTPIRDITYIHDIADGFIKIAEADASVGEVINIGYGRGYSIKNIVEELQNLLGKELNIVQDKSRFRPEKSEVMELVCSYKKAKELLKWSPKHSLQDGLRLTIEYLRDNLDSYKKELYTI